MSDEPSGEPPADSEAPKTPKRPARRAPAKSGAAKPSPAKPRAAKAAASEPAPAGGPDATPAAPEPPAFTGEAEASEPSGAASAAQPAVEAGSPNRGAAVDPDTPDPHMTSPNDPAGRSWYVRHFQTPAQERQFISSVSFGVTFAATRTVTHAIRDRRGPFRNVEVGGRHIHHMTFGILSLLGVGYLWLNTYGLPEHEHQTRASRATSIAYGAGSALTLDEFALWLNLQDDYWSKQGRESIDAVVMFGALLSAGTAARNHIADLFRRARGAPPA